MLTKEADNVSIYLIKNRDDGVIAEFKVYYMNIFMRGRRKPKRQAVEVVISEYRDNQRYIENNYFYRDRTNPETAAYVWKDAINNCGFERVTD